MNEFIQHFHWLRPEWLLGLVPAVLLSVLLWRRRQHRSHWQSVIAADLLPHLLEGQASGHSRRLYIALGCCWLLACIALAGPSWKKLPQPVHKTESALVILMDLSPSMLAEDLKPSRLVRTKHKLTDLLQARREGLTALVVYAGEAHVVSPLTDDTATIESLLPALSPQLMPLRGSNTEMAVEKALSLFNETGIRHGQILLATDGVTEEAAREVKSLLQDSGIQLSILGTGTDEGAPIPTAQGGFAKDRQGGIVIASLESQRLRNLSHALGGRYTRLRLDDSDIEWLTKQGPRLSEQTRELEREFDTWQEYGHWVAVALLPVLLLCFRRGLVLALIPLLLFPDQSQALSWDDLWLTGDQQGQRQLEAGDPKQAAEKFTTPQWRGAARYKSGEYEAALEDFSKGDTAKDHYNRGNAFARSGKLDEALAAYEQALERDPDFEDARFNHKLVEQLRDQQQSSQDQEQQSDQNQDANQSQSENNQQQDADQDSSQSQNQSQQDQTGNDSQPQDSSSDASSRDTESDKSEQPSAGDQQQPETKTADGPDQDEQEQLKQQQAQQAAEDDGNDTAEQKAQANAESELSPEEQQAMEQWLRQIPDDPSGLLRRKFKYQYDQRRKAYRAGTWEPPQNRANERW